jgi:hypothetical protein
MNNAYRLINTLLNVASLPIVCADVFDCNRYLPDSYGDEMTVEDDDDDDDKRLIGAAPTVSADNQDKVPRCHLRKDEGYCQNKSSEYKQVFVEIKSESNGV